VYHGVIIDQAQGSDANQDTIKTKSPELVSQSDEDEVEEEDVPEIYLPQLISPTMFLPIPNVCIYLSLRKEIIDIVFRVIISHRY
jgi:hypothetical protein